jgi:hypothetical protein
MSSKDLVFQQDPLGVILKSLSILFSKSFAVDFRPRSPWGEIDNNKLV